MAHVYDKPSHVTNANGVVIVHGPDAVDVVLTPEAAVATGSKLIDNAAEAKGHAEVEAERLKRKSS